MSQPKENTESEEMVTKKRKGVKPHYPKIRRPRKKRRT